MALTAMRKGVAASAVRAVVAVLSLALASVAHCAPRVALVVGNGGYDPSNVTRLANPVNDARLMAAALETVGFEVTLETDAGQEAMKRAIKAFGRRLRAAGSDAVGLFYYAGHGVEAGGSNYLIPLGAEVESAMDLASDAVPAQWVLSQMEAAGNRLNMVILDACRNNPYAGGVRGGGRGLTRMVAPSGALIAYSAAPGQVADDGEGENSPYTQALAGALVEPGLKVEDVFKRVRVRVEDETGRTGRRQTPWESSSLRGDFYFVASAEVDEEPGPVAGGGTPAADEAKDAYEIAVSENTIAAYRAVMEHFPGFYATLARRKVEELEAAALAEERRERREQEVEDVPAEAKLKEEAADPANLFAAVRAGDAPRVDVLLAGGANPNARDKGITVLHRAVANGDVAGIKVLLSAGADVNAQTSNAENTPLHTAARHGQVEAIRVLLSAGASLNARELSGGTPLHRAARYGQIEAIEALLSAGANVHARDDDRGTPLSWAAWKNQADAIETLLSAGANVNARDVYGDTPLHVAAMYDQTDAIEALLAGGARLNRRNKDGKTPLQEAVSRDMTAAARMLRRAGGQM